MTPNTAAHAAAAYAAYPGYGYQAYGYQPYGYQPYGYAGYGYQPGMEAYYGYSAAYGAGVRALLWSTSRGAAQVPNLRTAGRASFALLLKPPQYEHQ